MPKKCLFNYQFLFGDHTAKLSNEAKLLLIEMMFHADYGFVSTAKGIIDSRGFTLDHLQELINNGDVLQIPNRCEVFMTCYFVHNDFDPKCWMKSVFYTYWKDKLYIKTNRIAALKKNKDQQTEELNASNVIPNKPDEDWLQDVMGVKFS